MIRFRVLFPWLVGLLIVVAARGAIWSAIDVQNDLRLARRPSVFQQGMKRREATRISSDQWTEFQINQGSRRVRVMTNAVVSRTDAVVEDEILRPLEDPRSGWRYGVDYELLDLAKRPLERSTYHFRSQTDQWVDPETGEYHFAISLDQPGVAVAQTKVMQFTPQATNHPCYLRLRLGRRDAAVESVYVRVFDQVERPEHDREKTWARMSTRQRERLCANSVFGSELLSIDERNELLRLMWMPSVKHNHFETETLFFLDDSHEMQGSNSQHQQSDAGPEIAGVVVDPQQSVSYCVPREPGNLQIVTSMVIDASSSIDALKHGGVTIQYQCGVSADGLSRDSVSDVGGVVNFPVCGGLLTLKSDSSARALVSWMPSELSESSAAVPIELEPQLGRSRVYLVDDQSLVFDVHTAADQATPCKLVLRIPNDAIFDVEDQQGGVSVFEDALARQKDQGSDVTVRCELFNGFGRVVQTYQIDCSPSHATLDRLDLFGRAGAVSLPTIRYFQLSSDI
ncbi:MAG: hypothetical protein KDB00_01195, partial [Planctomycetales bacterium]|nr:hypothetical protein [Planctomycetales bacterium]